MAKEVDKRPFKRVQISQKCYKIILNTDTIFVSRVPVCLSQLF